MHVQVRTVNYLLLFVIIKHVNVRIVIRIAGLFKQKISYNFMTFNSIISYLKIIDIFKNIKLWTYRKNLFFSKKSTAQFLKKIIVNSQYIISNLKNQKFSIKLIQNYKQSFYLLVICIIIVPKTILFIPFFINFIPLQQIRYIQLMQITQQQKLHVIKFSSIQNKDQYIVFRPTISPSILKLINQPNEQLRQRYFQILYIQIGGNIQYSKYPELHMNQQQLIQALQNIVEFTRQQFKGAKYTGNEKHEIIRLKIKNIQSINFRNLKILIFNDCNIDNVQALSRLDMKCINKIWLYQNNIVSLKPFTKTYFPDLKSLSIAYNLYPYHQIIHIQRGGLRKLLSFYTVFRQPKICNLRDLRVLTKLQINQQRLIDNQKLVIFVNPQIKSLKHDNLKIKLRSDFLILLHQY